MKSFKNYSEEVNNPVHASFWLLPNGEIINTQKQNHFEFAISNSTLFMITRKDLLNIKPPQKEEKQMGLLFTKGAVRIILSRLPSRNELVAVGIKDYLNLRKETLIDMTIHYRINTLRLFVVDKNNNVLEKQDIIINKDIMESLKEYNKNSCDFNPLNATKRIDSQTLLDDTLNIHFGADTLGAEESDLPSRINEYYWYNLKLINIKQLQYVDDIKNTPYQIEEGKIEKNKQLIQQHKSYPPIIVDIMGDIIDGYHRVFALKELGCSNVWAYVPDKNSKTEPLEEIEEE